MYFRGAAAAVIVFEITSTDSFNKAKDWVKELQRQVRAAVPQQQPMRVTTQPN